MQELENQPLQVDNTDDLPPAERQQLDDALRRLADTRVELLNQLDQELGRKLNILVRLNLSQEQLRKITENLHDTISEQTFWMPSTQPLPAWIRDFPPRYATRWAPFPGSGWATTPPS